MDTFVFAHHPAVTVAAPNGAVVVSNIPKLNPKAPQTQAFPFPTVGIYVTV